MEFRSLSRYRGLADSPRMWGEPDERGNLPAIHLRDYVTLAVLIALCLPILVQFIADSWIYHQRVTTENTLRQEWMRKAVATGLEGQAGPRD